jgi:alpha-1,4-galacturonosyltransferase
VLLLLRGERLKRNGDKIYEAFSEKLRTLMNQVRRWQRILILSLLLLSVLAPIVFVSNRLKSITSVDRGEFIEELSDITDKTEDELRLTAIEQDEEGLKEPKRILQDRDFNSVVLSNSSDKSNDTVQSNEGDQKNFLSEVDKGNIFRILCYFVLLSLSGKLSYL